MVIKNSFEATLGKRSTREIASRSSTSAVEKGFGASVRRRTSRVIFGGLPSSTASGKSTGLLPK